MYKKENKNICKYLYICTSKILLTNIHQFSKNKNVLQDVTNKNTIKKDGKNLNRLL